MCHDLTEHGLRPLAHIALGGVQHHTPIFVDFKQNSRTIPIADGAVAADMHGSRYALATTFSRVSGCCAGLVPSNRVCALIQTFNQPGTADFPTVHRGFARSNRIELMHCYRVKPQSARHGIDVAVQSEQHGRSAKPTECAVRWRVCVGECGVATYVFEAVHVVAAHGGDVHDLATQTCVSATIGQDLDVLCQDQTVFAHAQTQGDALWQA